MLGRAGEEKPHHLKDRIAEALRTGKLVVLKPAEEKSGSPSSDNLMNKSLVQRTGGGKLPSFFRKSGGEAFSPARTAGFAAYQFQWKKDAKGQTDPLSNPMWSMLRLYSIQATYSVPEDAPGDLSYEEELVRGLPKDKLTGFTVLGDMASVPLRTAIHKLLRGYLQSSFGGSDSEAVKEWTRNFIVKYRFRIESTSPEEELSGDYLVKFTIDAKGAATAEVLGRIQASTVPQLSKSVAAAKLLSVYGLTVIEGGQKWEHSSGKTFTTQGWTEAELSEVVAALALMPEKDRGALQGVQLLRVDKLPGETDGLFQTDYANKSSLVFDDDVFTPLANAFGSAEKAYPFSFHTILHEVGHAVEKQDVRAVEEALQAAQSPWKVKVGTKRPAPKSAKDEQNTPLAAAKKAYVMFKQNGQLIKRSVRLQKFIDLVNNAKNGAYTFTKYSRDQWKLDKPQEFFAEAYVFWLLESDFVKNYYPAIHDFFEQGQYRSKS